MATFQGFTLNNPQTALGNQLGQAFAQQDRLRIGQAIASGRGVESVLGQLLSPQGQQFALQHLQQQQQNQQMNPLQQAQIAQMQAQTGQIGQLTPLQQQQILESQARTGQMRRQTELIENLTPAEKLALQKEQTRIAERNEDIERESLTKAGDIQILETDDGFVSVNKLTGERTPLGLNPKVTKDRLVVEEFQNLDKKVQDGTATEDEKARRNNILSATQNITVGKVPPIGLYDRIDVSSNAISAVNELLGMFEPGSEGTQSVGEQSTGLFNSLIAFYQDKFGVLSPDKQKFLQAHTRLFSVLKDLNGEARMSDADLRFLINAIPKKSTNPAAFVAGLHQLKKNSIRKLETNVNRVTQGKQFTVSPDNLEYYERLKQPIGSTASDAQKRETLKQRGWTDAQIDAALEI